MKLSKLVIIGFVLTIFTSCTVDDIEEEETIQSFDTHASGQSRMTSGGS